MAEARKGLAAQPSATLHKRPREHDNCGERPAKVKKLAPKPPAAVTQNLDLDLDLDKNQRDRDSTTSGSIAGAASFGTSQPRSRKAYLPFAAEALDYLDTGIPPGTATFSARLVTALAAEARKSKEFDSLMRSVVDGHSTEKEVFYFISLQSVVIAELGKEQHGISGSGVSATRSSAALVPPPKRKPELLPPAVSKARSEYTDMYGFEGSRRSIDTYAQSILWEAKGVAPPTPDTAVRALALRVRREPQFKNLVQEVAEGQAGGAQRDQFRAAVIANPRAAPEDANSTRDRPALGSTATKSARTHADSLAMPQQPASDMTTKLSYGPRLSDQRTRHEGRIPASTPGFTRVDLALKSADQMRNEKSANMYDAVVSKLAHYAMRIERLFTAVMNVAYGKPAISELSYFDDWVDTSICDVRRADEINGEGRADRSEGRVDRTAASPDDQRHIEDVPDTAACQVLAMKAKIALDCPQLCMQDSQVKSLCAEGNRRFGTRRHRCARRRQVWQCTHQYRPAASLPTPH